ncbi:MAG: hypothetical protein Q8N89_15010 [Azonexus sp.]|nr:hypothetical protein [Azonexus sp.]
MFPARRGQEAVRCLAAPGLIPAIRIFTFFLCPAFNILQNLEIDLPNIVRVSGPLKRENMDTVNFLLAVAAILVPLGLAWLFINRK